MRLRWVSTSAFCRSAWLKICAACTHACMVASVQCIGIVDVMFRILYCKDTDFRSQGMEECAWVWQSMHGDGLVKGL